MIVLRLSSQDFNDTAICLGPQIAAVLETLVCLPELAQASWYAADIDFIGDPESINPDMSGFMTDAFAPISDMPMFLARTRTVTQWLDGLVVAVPSGAQPIALEGQDEPTDKLVENALVQVLAYDTTVIEIGADASVITEKLRERFGGHTIGATRKA